MLLELPTVCEATRAAVLRAREGFTPNMNLSQMVVYAADGGKDLRAPRKDDGRARGLAAVRYRKTEWRQRRERLKVRRDDVLNEPRVGKVSEQRNLDGRAERIGPSLHSRRSNGSNIR